MASPRRLERSLFILTVLLAHLPAVLLHNHCSSNYNVTYDNEVIIARGGGTCLFCDYSGTSQSLKWYHGTSVITDGNLDDPCDCTIPENSRMLCFEQVTEMAEGDYSCRVQTGFGQSDDCLFTVSLAVAPRIIAPFPAENYNLTEADTLIIPLSISPGIPPATVEWTKDGSVVSRETNLTVPNINAQHRGVYTVTIFNIGGMESRDFNVYVQFLEVEVIAPVRMDNGMYEVRCEIIGYPQLNFVQWSTPDGNLLATDTDILKNMFEDEITTTLTLSQEECSASDSFMCVASTRNGGRTSTSSTSGCSSISRIRVTTLTSTSVRVEWNQPVMARDTFIIRYRQLQNGQIIERQVANTETSVVIEGLMAGYDYEFTGLIEENDSGNNAVTVSLPLCTDSAVPGVPTNVRASTNVRPSTNVDNNVREISVLWDGSTSISSYRLYIKVSNGTETSVIVSGNATTYTLAPRTYQCSNNVVYTFIVQGLNQCGEGGQNSSSVDVACLPGTQIQDTSTDTEGTSSDGATSAHLNLTTIYAAAGAASGLTIIILILMVAILLVVIVATRCKHSKTEEISTAASNTDSSSYIEKNTNLPDYEDMTEFNAEPVNAQPDDTTQDPPQIPKSPTDSHGQSQLHNDNVALTENTSYGLVLNNMPLTENASYGIVSQPQNGRDY